MANSRPIKLSRSGLDCNHNRNHQVSSRPYTSHCSSLVGNLQPFARLRCSSLRHTPLQSALLRLQQRSVSRRPPPLSPTLLHLSSRRARSLSPEPLSSDLDSSNSILRDGRHQCRVHPAAHTDSPSRRRGPQGPHKAQEG